MSAGNDASGRDLLPCLLAMVRAVAIVREMTLKATGLPMGRELGLSVSWGRMRSGYCAAWGGASEVDLSFLSLWGNETNLGGGTRPSTHRCFGKVLVFWTTLGKKKNGKTAKLRSKRRGGGIRLTMWARSEFSRGLESGVKRIPPCIRGGPN